MSDAEIPCPGCNIARVDAPECPACGIIYARADARRARVAMESVAPEFPVPPPPPSYGHGDLSPVEPWRPVTPAWDSGMSDARRELIIRAAAIPGALLFAWLFTSTGLGRFVARTFSGMWFHELGHASTAWLCALPAFPGPWLTRVGSERSFVVGAMIAALLGAGIHFGWRLRSTPLVAASGVLLVGLGVGSLGISLQSAEKWMVFGGDAGALVLGTVAMTTINARRSSKLTTGGLRWGFLVLGALAIADTAATWFAARADFAEIPFGANEGINLSDATRLVDTFGWSETELISRYINLTLACLAALAVSWAWGLWQAKLAWDEEERG